uniref:Peptidase M1 leukotriene A4 hydrolase/aminopeptidase C-terminal domain-containing protein n=2 Tax=Chromera velia CCMP2878 TaxID=1169474 RepID=A0A0G4FRB4_9ALVE|eukprot:Cvel_18372.t1-p1 / transcript=Cvel_18372.t1 / gene=Cvel_18372 / organism=Chromera_velia_CCMP2878 / gene_product=Leukotriene A-4 hydrolase homolog, putative / transcript_product=Leukotriene A-4 hydrolase homolog, putative / location=Cvel_scaffold1518:41604-44081(+) / protein_length=697 / sequence_SO=supercontig / SO=protein_coding / is_pseudo=false
MTTTPRPDVHSFSNFTQVTTRSLDLSVSSIDFEQKTLDGFSCLELEVLSSEAKEVVLDIGKQKITGVTAGVIGRESGVTQWQTPNFSIDPPTEHLGRPLRIPIPEGAKQQKGALFHVKIHFTTAPGTETPGVDWLPAESTSSQTHPLVYSQFQAILARTVFPCMDCPAVKAPFAITVTTPDGMAVACSGTSAPTAEAPCQISAAVPVKGGTYRYVQTNPVPSYLIAFACGHLVHLPMSARCGVVGDPKEVAPGVEELRGVPEAAIRAAEEITGVRYHWGRYDILVLPRFFPFGGMENPNLTFMNACLLTGSRPLVPESEKDESEVPLSDLAKRISSVDKCLVDVVVHEICHSWAGNLVTNAQWCDFWLNEGFDEYLTRAVLERLFGADYRKFQHRVGLGEMEKAVIEWMEGPEEEREYAKVVPNVDSIDPDDAFSRIPYERGCAVLLRMEQKIGRQAMILWLKSHFSDNAKGTVTTEGVLQHFKEKHPKAHAELDWQEILYRSDYPPHDFEDIVASPADALLQEALRASGVSRGSDGKPKMTPMEAGDLKEKLSAVLSSSSAQWSDLHTSAYLDELLLIPGERPLSPECAQVIDSILGSVRDGGGDISSCPVTELSYRALWLRLRARDLSVEGLLRSFLCGIGRGVYLKALYCEAAKMDAQMAGRIYREARGRYHPTARTQAEKALGPEGLKAAGLD